MAELYPCTAVLEDTWDGRVRQLHVYLVMAELYPRTAVLEDTRNTVVIAVTSPAVTGYHTVVTH